jgi:transketolase
VDRGQKMHELEKKAWELRLSLLRMFSHGKAHHFGGSFSCAELVACLYFYKLNYGADRIGDPRRDRFIMSKGHAVPCQYAALAMLGILSLEELATIKTLGSRLQGHPDMLKTPGIEAPTGSLGQGLSFANGLALAARLDGLDFNIFLILGDGEIQEGQIWEAAMTSAHYGLGNICVIVDRNGFQSQGEVKQMMGIEPLEDKWRAFGWRTLAVDGHDVRSVCAAFDQFPAGDDKPTAVIARTVKGRGISFTENTYRYHNFSLSAEEYRRAEAELTARLDELAGPGGGKNG